MFDPYVITYAILSSILFACFVYIWNENKQLRTELACNKEYTRKLYENYVKSCCGDCASLIINSDTEVEQPAEIFTVKEVQKK